MPHRSEHLLWERTGQPDAHLCARRPPLLTCPSSPRRDRDYHLKTYKSVLPGSKLVDWLLAQVRGPPACASSLLALPGTGRLTRIRASQVLGLFFFFLNKFPIFFTLGKNPRDAYDLNRVSAHDA